MRVTYMTSVNHTLAPNATVLLHAYNFAPNPRKPAQTLAFAHKTSRKFGLVYTSYADGQPESSVTYFWQDEKTGALHHELVYLEPAPFETALAFAQTHAPTRGVERIHVKHERGKKALGREPRRSEE